MKRDWMPLPWPGYMLRDVGLEALTDEIAARFCAGAEGRVADLKTRGLLRAGDRVLDVRCGVGGYARALVDEDVASYVGVDRYPGMVQWCARELAPLDARLSFHEYDEAMVAERWPWEDGAFDLALVDDLFRGLDADGAAAVLGQLARVLAPDGRACVVVSFAVAAHEVMPNFLATEQPHTDPELHLHSASAFRAAAADAGLELELFAPQAAGPALNRGVLRRAR